MRYAAPLVAGLAVPAAVLCSDLLSRPHFRPIAIVLTSRSARAQRYTLSRICTSFCRPTASAWLLDNVPRNPKILVEPTHNRPPTGSYLSDNIDFNATT
jgi:hypothetical protein